MPDWATDVAPALAKTLAELVERQCIVADYFERAVDRLCSEYVLTAVNITDLPCQEIDFPADLEEARREIVPKLEG